MEKKQSLIDFVNNIYKQSCWTHISFPRSICDGIDILSEKTAPITDWYWYTIDIMKKEVKEAIWDILDVMPFKKRMIYFYIIDYIVNNLAKHPLLTQSPYYLTTSDFIKDLENNIINNISLIEKLNYTLKQIKDFRINKHFRPLSLYITKQIHQFMGKTSLTPYLFNDLQLEYSYVTYRIIHLYWYYPTHQEQAKYNITAIVKGFNGSIIFLNNNTNIMFKFRNKIVKEEAIPQNEHNFWSILFKFDTERTIDKVFTNNYIDYEKYQDLDHNIYRTGPIFGPHLIKIELNTELPKD